MALVLRFFGLLVCELPFSGLRCAFDSLFNPLSRASQDEKCVELEFQDFAYATPYSLCTHTGYSCRAHLLSLCVLVNQKKQVEC